MIGFTALLVSGRAGIAASKSTYRHTHGSEEHIEINRDTKQMEEAKPTTMGDLKNTKYGVNMVKLGEEWNVLICVALCCPGAQSCKLVCL